MHTPLHRRFPLTRGAHPDRSGGLCTLELVAWLAGEEHSDEPDCVCPTLISYIRALNDLLDDAGRERLLRPLAPRLVGTRGDVVVADIRRWQLADCTARVFAARTLDRAGHHDAATALRTVPAIEEAADALEPLRILTRHRHLARAAHWTLDRAASGAEPRLWLPGVPRAAREADALDLAAEIAIRVIRGEAAPVAG